MEEYFIVVNNDLFDYIHKFESNFDIDINTKKLIENTSTDKFISYFDLKKFILDNKQSYGNRLEKIYIQFEKDFPRQTIVLNGSTYETQQDFIDKLDFLLNKINYVPFYMKLIFPFSNLSTTDLCQGAFNVSYKDLILLLCCQSSFYLPYQILRNVYDSEDNNTILVSSSGKKDNIFTTINITDNALNIELNTILLIKDMDTNIVIKKLDVALLANIDFSENNVSNSHIVVFTWNISKI